MTRKTLQRAPMMTTVVKTMMKNRIGQKSWLRLRRPDMPHKDQEKVRKVQ